MKRFIYYLILIALVLVFLFSGWSLLSYFWEGHKSQSRYDELASMVEQARPTEVISETVPDSADASVPTTEGWKEGDILPEYQALSERNPDFVAWIAIEDTVINYPVVQTPRDPEYYLHRDFDGAPNDRGCLFADANCDVEQSDNVIVYGHHMNDGSMFASLLDYSDKEFWKEHPEIRFDTLTQRRTYEIFAIFRTTASVGQGFPYHQFVDAGTEEEFDNYVATCKSLSLYDTGIIPEYGDKLLCLSTCEYTRENGRFVVMGVYRPE